MLRRGLGGGAEPFSEFVADDGDGDVGAASLLELGGGGGGGFARVGDFDVEGVVGVELRDGELPQVFVQVARFELAFGHLESPIP